MKTIAILLVLGSGFLHAIWNLYTKKSLNKNVFLWFCQWVAILIFLPWFLQDIRDLHLPTEGYLLLMASMILHGLYVFLLALTYSVGDLSQVYPIMRGTSPLLVPFAGVFLLNEHLSPFGWVGVILIIGGIVLLSEIRFFRKSTTSIKATLLALGVGICIAGYITVDKLTLAYMSPVVLNEASNVGNLLALTWISVKSGEIKKEWRVNWKTILFAGLIAPLGYLLFLYALSLAPVARLAPMREIGTVFGTLLGIFILREGQGVKRIVSSVMITAGVILLGTYE